MQTISAHMQSIYGVLIITICDAGMLHLGQTGFLPSHLGAHSKCGPEVFKTNFKVNFDGETFLR